MFHPLDWFRNRIGQKVIATHPDGGKGTITIKDDRHARAFHDSQPDGTDSTTTGYAYQDHTPELEEGNTIPDLLMLEMLTLPDSTPAADQPDIMEGGDFGGGGASGSWSDDASQNDDATSDNSSSDS